MKNHLTFALALVTSPSPKLIGGFKSVAASIFCIGCLYGTSWAAAGTVVTDLNLDQEKVGSSPSGGHYQVNSSPTETVLVQSTPEDSTKKEIVLTGTSDSSGAKKLIFDYPSSPISGLVTVDTEFTIPKMEDSQNDIPGYSNVWSYIFALGDTNLIFTIGANGSSAADFALDGVKDAQGQSVSHFPWKLGQTYKVQFTFNFTTQKVDITIDGNSWVKDLPIHSSALNTLVIGDGQAVGGGGKHLSQLAISRLTISQN